jgi:hypothetical protein
MAFLVGSIVLAVLYASFLEWGLHKYVLHKMGKKKKSIWASHFYTHHRHAVKFNGGDPDYLKWNLSPEIKGLTFLTIAHAPIAWLSAPAYITMIFYTLAYYYAHRKSHLDPMWGWKYIPWHMDHHLGRAKEKNWCVLVPVADYALGTRVKSNKNPYCKSS